MCVRSATRYRLFRTMYKTQSIRSSPERFGKLKNNERNAAQSNRLAETGTKSNRQTVCFISSERYATDGGRWKNHISHTVVLHDRLVKVVVNTVRKQSRFRLRHYRTRLAATEWSRENIFRFNICAFGRRACDGTPAV